MFAEDAQAQRLRVEYQEAIDLSGNDERGDHMEDLPENHVRRIAIAAARRRADELRLTGRIGDEAYRALETEFDWTELGATNARII